MTGDGRRYTSRVVEARPHDRRRAPEPPPRPEPPEERRLGFYLVVGSLVGFSTVAWLVAHAGAWTRPRNLAVGALLVLAAAVSLTLPRRRGQGLRMVALVVLALALQLLEPHGHLLLLLSVAAASVGAWVRPERVAPTVAAAIGTAALVTWAQARLGGGPLTLTGLFVAAFAVATPLLFTHTMVTLRRGRDETARLYRELELAHAELRRYAAQAEELATLRERARLARELHDTLGHALTTLTVQLEAIGRTARARPERLEPLLEDARTLSRRAMTDLRESLGDLRREAQPRSLAEALRGAAEDAAARAGWRLELELAPVELPPTTAHAVLRVAREALANAERHARAATVRLSLERRDDGVELELQDDGVGFDPAAPGGDRYGVRGMRERAALLGARLELTSAPGRGTRVRLRLPLGSEAAPS